MLGLAFTSLASATLLVLLPLSVPVWLTPETLAGGLILLRVAGGGRLGLILLPFVLGLLQAGDQQQQRLDPELAGLDVTWTGTVCDFPRVSGPVTRFRLRPDPVRGSAWRPRAIDVAWYDAPMTPQPGEVWHLHLRMREVRGTHGAGGADRERLWLREEVAARAYVRPSPANLRQPGARPGCPLAAPRAWLANAIAQELGQRPATAYLQALAVADRSGLGPQDWDRLRDTGTVHLMAISGLHIGLVAGLGAGFGRLLGCGLLAAGLSLPPRALAVVPALLLAAGYSALAGFSIPTLRALLMVCLAAGLVALRRAIDPWQLLALTALVVLIFDPLAVLETGFWLSFSAVSVLLIPALRADRQPGQSAGWLRRSLAAQGGIALGLAPLGVALFGQIAPLAPMANLLLIPLFALAIVPLALLGCLLLPFDLGLPLHAAAWLLEAGLAGLDVLSAPDWARWEVSSLPPAVLVLATLAAGLAIWPRPRAGPLALLLLVMPAVLASLVAEPRPGLRVLVIDVGQGLAVLIQTRRHSVLYDTGPAYQGGGNAAVTAVLPLLKELGVARLDRIIASHADMDHAGGLASLAERFPQAVLSGSQPVADLPVRRCGAGQRWRWDDVEFQMLHPGAAAQRLTGSDNDQSCVLLVSVAGASVLLPGDISRRAERSILRNVRADAVDLVLAPHHGSETSSGAEFVAATRPRYVVFTTAHANRWGFPRLPVMSRWSLAGPCLLSTAAHGTLRFDNRGGSPLSLRSASRRDRRRLWTSGAAPPDCLSVAAPVK